MNNQKSSKIKFNLLSGILYQVVIISFGFLLPRLYLVNFGSEVNGVLSTIKQIFTYLCLLEAGVGLAATQALYKPVAAEDRASVNSILSAAKRYYQKTGIFYAAAVLLIAFAYAFFANTELPPKTIFLLVLLNGIPYIFSYLVQAKYRLLLEVDGRKYILTNSETLVQILSSIGKILVLLLTDSLILIYLVYCIIAVAQLAFVYFYAKHRYNWLDFSVKPDYTSIAQKNSVLIHQISAMVFNNTDVLLLSFLCDFKIVSVYTIYNMFFSQMQSFITSIVSGFTFALGQLFHTDKKEFIRCYNAYETFYLMATFIIYTLMCVFLLPLIQIYTGGINDADYTNPLLVILFALMQLLANGKLPSNQMIEFSGEFKNTRWHAVAEMVINLVVSIAAILQWGICGAIAGTVAALFFRSVVTIYYSNKKVLRRSTLHTYGLWLLDGAVFTAIMLLFGSDHFSGMSFGPLLLNGILHAIWIVALYIAVNFIFRREEFK